MKKISAVAVKQTKNFREQKLTIGLDLGDRSSWYCVLDEVGEVLLEQELGTTPKAMKEAFRGMPRSRIALETGMHSPCVRLGLTRYSQPLRLPVLKCSVIDFVRENRRIHETTIERQDARAIHRFTSRRSCEDDRDGARTRE
jgi:hypothetical protein